MGGRTGQGEWVISKVFRQSPPPPSFRDSMKSRSTRTIFKYERSIALGIDRFIADHKTLGWRLCHMAVFAHVLQGDFKSEFGRLPFVHKVITFGRTWWDLWRFKILRINRPLTVQSIFRITGNRCRNNRFLSSFKSTNYQPFKILQSVCLCERARRFGLKEYDWIRYLLVC